MVSPSRAGGSRAWALAIGAAVAATLLGGAVTAGRERTPPVPGSILIDRGALRSALVETGSLRARRSLTLVSEVQGNRAKVVQLVPEGDHVAKGDVVISFDPTPFEEEILKLEAELQEASGALAEAVALLGVVDAQGLQDVESAEQRARMAELEARNVEAGSGPLALKESAFRAREAARRADEAAEELADLEQMLAKGYVTVREVERARREAEQATEEASLAEEAHQALLEVGHPTELERARSTRARGREEVEQVRAAAAHRRERQRASVQKAEGKLAVYRDRLERARRERDRCSIVAPVDGFVLYETLGFGEDRRKPQIGDTIWSGQAIATIPDTEELEVHTRVREVDLHRVEEGQRAVVGVEAYPDLRLEGRVGRVGLLAADPRGREAWEKSFQVVVSLDGSDRRLRPGMTARVEITTLDEPDALRIPVSAVRWLAPGAARAWVVSEDGTTRERAIRVEEGDASFYRVVGGLEEGEAVLLEGSP